MDLHTGEYVEFREDGGDEHTERFYLNGDFAVIVDLMRAQEILSTAICRDNVATEDGRGIIDGAIVGILTVPEVGVPTIRRFQ